MDIEQIIKELRDRFPLLSHIFLQGVEWNSVPEALPPYLGILLAVMDVPPDRPLCFVFPRRGDVARIAVVLHALHRLIKKQKQLTYTYGESKFSKGDIVRIHPNRHVFRYGGFDDDWLDYIWLETMDGMGRRRESAVNILPRLEKTTLNRPIGRLDSLIRSPAPAPLDALIGVSMFGNQSLIQNEIVTLDSHGGFTDFAESVVLQPNPPCTDMPLLKDLLPFGDLTQPTTSQPSWLKKWDERNSTGEPLIAVTHSAELLANYCIDAQARSKVVVVNGLSRLRNLQAYDDVAQMQRLVLFADHDDEEMIEVLGKRGCRFWFLSGPELLAVTNGPHSGILGSVSRWARNYDKLSVDDGACENAQLDTACLCIEKLRSVVIETDDGPLTRLVSRAWKMFGDARNAFHELTSNEQKIAIAELDSFGTDIQRARAWISPETVHMLQNVADAIAECYKPGSRLGVSKGAVLYQTLAQSLQAGNKVALLARNENKVGELRQWLYQHSLSTEPQVYSPRTLPNDEAFDHVICVSWPGGDAMKQVVSKLAAPRITVIGYPCERHWLRQCQPRFQQRPQAPSLTGKEKAVFIAGKEEIKPAWLDEQEQQGVLTPTAPPADIWNFERQLRAARIGLAARPTDAMETVLASYVRFAGDSYAFLTESHKLPVATDLVSGIVRPNQKLPERNILEIKPGDFVVFPESGEREFVQMVADKGIGPTAPQLRKLARKWKDALQKSGLTPEQFQSQARSFNRRRHPSTIRYWFADSSQIGPREKDDLVLIALVTGDECLEAEIDDVRLAIERLWSAHLSAGMRLRDALLQRLPRVMGQVEENGTKVDLDELGSAWVVQVDSVAPHTEPRGRSEVNRLLWEQSSYNPIEFV